MKEKNYILYKIYYEEYLLYLGRTKQPLQDKLRNHFFKTSIARPINIEQVTKIEYAKFKSVADLYLYEIYYINKLKPSLNRDDKAKDELTVSLPEVIWMQFETQLIEKWKVKIAERDKKDEEKRYLKIQIKDEKRKKKREIFSRSDISSEEKINLWDDYLMNFYEPVINELI